MSSDDFNEDCVFTISYVPRYEKIVCLAPIVSSRRHSLKRGYTLYINTRYVLLRIFNFHDIIVYANQTLKQPIPQRLLQHTLHHLLLRAIPQPQDPIRLSSIGLYNVLDFPTRSVR